MNDSLIEVDVGNLEGRSEVDSGNFRTFIGILVEWLNGNKRVRFPGGESLEEVEQRIETVLESASNDTILVGHCTFFALMMAQKGFQYETTEDLFLPRAGVVQYFEGDGTWNKIGQPNHRVERTPKTPGL